MKMKISPKYLYMLGDPPAKTPLQVMVDECQEFADGMANFAGLNGASHLALQWAKEEKLHPEIVDLIDQVHSMVNQCWNEWGLNSDAISEEVLIRWLREEILPKTETEQGGPAPDGA